MTNLWVELQVGGWVRADQIGEIDTREVFGSASGRRVPAGGTVSSAGWAVVVRMAYSAGSWNDDGGDLGPREREVATLADQATAKAAARQLLFALAQGGRDDAAVLRLSRDGEVAYDEVVRVR
ncbi:hypothetical protein ACWF9G_22620 [Nocardia sp. NPDC055029]